DRGHGFVAFGPGNNGRILPVLGICAIRGSTPGLLAGRKVQNVSSWRRTRPIDGATMRRRIGLKMTRSGPTRRYASLFLEVRGLENLRPAIDVTFHDGSERLLTAARLVRDLVNEVEEPLADILVIQSLVEGVGEFVEDWFRRRPGSKQGDPT